MKKFVTVILSVLMIAALIGCAQKQAAAPPEQPTAKPGEGSLQPGQLPPATPEDIKAAVQEIQTRIGDVYFSFDKYDLDSKAKGTLGSLADLLKRKNVTVVVEGNCDERGTKEYNLALGDKRATASKQYLITLGISSSRVSTISYGKEKPVCTESTEGCWAKNRRDHFIVPEAGQ